MDQIFTVNEQNPITMKKILFTFLFLVAFMAGYTQMANNGGTITVEGGAVLVIEGDYTSTGSGVIKIDGNVQLKGNFINNSGTIDPASVGTLTFNGTGAQQIGGTTSTTFNCLVVVNNTNGVSLTGADAVLAKALTLTNGKLTLNAYDLTMAAVGITVTPGNWVVTNNAAGELKGVVGASNVTFPVGSATSYNPVILNNTGGTSDTYGVVYTAALPAGFTPTDHAVTGNWAVSEANAPLGSNLTVTPQWNGAEELLPFDRTDCAVGVSDGTTVTWAASGAAVANGSAWTRSGSPFTTLGAFVVGDYFYEGIVVDLDLFLAGPYNTGAGNMNIGLKTKNLIPLTDPYGLGITVASIPANVVDWIKVELRDKTTPATILYTKTFFLDNTGNVIHTDGVTANAKFTGVPKDLYYIAVKHRNHLGVRTAATVDLAAASPAFNFKSNTGVFQNQTYLPQATLASGIYGLYKGNVNSDAAVRKTGPAGGNDYSALLAYLFPNTQLLNVYAGADVNMDGDVKKTGPAAANDYSHLLNTLPGITTQRLQQIP